MGSSCQYVGVGHKGRFIGAGNDLRCRDGASSEKRRAGNGSCLRGKYFDHAISEFKDVNLDTAMKVSSHIRLREV